MSDGTVIRRRPGNEERHNGNRHIEGDGSKRGNRHVVHAHDARRSFGSASYEIVRHRYSFETFRQAYEDLLSEA